jgi:hypothetical protein
MLSQFDVDQQRETRRQQALQGFVDGIGAMEDKKKTKRAEALAISEHTRKLKEAGYDVNEDMVRKNLDPQEPTLAQKTIGGTGLGNLLGIEPHKEEKIDLYGKRTQEWQDKQIADREDRQYKAEGEKLDRKFKRTQIAKMEAESQKDISDAKRGKQMSASDVAKFDEGNQIPTMLQDIKATIEANKDTFGPVAGRISALNPWDDKGQAIESQMTASAQAFGKFMEGGVLRAEDVPKYRKMFPNQSDTPETAANKLANVERLLAQKQNSTVGALRGAGYDVSSIDKGLQVPAVPGVIAGNKRPGIINEAKASEIKKQLKTMSRAEKEKLLQGN